LVFSHRVVECFAAELISVDPSHGKRHQPTEAKHKHMSTERNLPRVVLVDDHPAILRQVIQLLSSEFEIVEALEDGATLPAVVDDFAPDLIVLDITLGTTSGIELALALKKAGCPAKIIFLTVHADADYAREAFLVGASGYVLKSRIASDLDLALKTALAGKRFLSPSPELAELGYYFQS
jgi:DNA-binding NarL/FixJ family response regulator